MNDWADALVISIIAISGVVIAVPEIGIFVFATIAHIFGPRDNDA